MIFPPGAPSMYLLGILVAFVLPVLVFGRTLFAGARRGPVYLTVVLVSAIGWSWSWVLSSNSWWHFPEKWIVHHGLLPYLPVEEILFYPAGILFILGIYIRCSRMRPSRMPASNAYFILLLAGTAFFLGLFVRFADKGPYYLASQLCVYNTLAILLHRRVRMHLNPVALGISTLLLGIIGFAWDHFAFKFGWWVYHAVIGIKIVNVPIEDFNFFLFATPAGVSLYEWAASRPRNASGFQSSGRMATRFSLKKPSLS